MKKYDITIKNNNVYGGKEIIIESVKDFNQVNQNQNVFVKLLTGAFIGIINGFCGGGGGMICVPLLMYVIRLPEKKSHATTILIMLPLCITSLIVYILNGSLGWLDSLKVGLGFVLGGVIGALLLKVIKNAWLGVIFSIIIIAGGIKILL
jgi:uncharacterized membrane protein YfcA